MAHKILVVEDFEPVRNMYVDVLKRCKMPTLTASNGEDALRLINTEHPSMILLDVDLPRLSGLEVLKRIRNNPSRQNMRVIIVTGNRAVEHSETIQDADMVLIKPVSPMDILSFVRRFLPATSGS